MGSMERSPSEVGIDDQLSMSSGFDNTRILRCHGGESVLPVLRGG